MTDKSKVAVIGLDCAEPDLVFHKFREHLPNLSKLMDNGFCSRMRSSDPPITVPAWSVLFSGRDPGELGVYGFRNRMNYGYENLVTADSNFIREKRIWNLASEAGLDSIVIGVPQTYPVVDFKGYMVSGMLAPEINEHAVFPKSLMNELHQIAPEYEADVKNFRTEDRDSLLKKIYSMTRERFKFARHLLDTKPWDLFIFVEIGLDRVQHAFWQYMAKDSPFYLPGNRFENVILKYYQYLDFEIGLLLKRFDEHTQIVIVSDHGAKTFKGVFFINDWLRKEGYLSLKKEPDVPEKLTSDMIDWNNTRVWAEGGYYGRIFFNIKDRENSGIIPRSEIQSMKKEIKRKLTDSILWSGKILKNIVLDPPKIYRQTRAIPPDLIVYFDELSLRASATVGNKDLVSEKNDTGPDGANHDFYGIFITNFKVNDRLDEKDISIYDVTPTLLKLLNLESGSDLVGKSLF